ncbi:PQ-loop domain-containing transporter [Chloroflexota bacterium]
MGLVAGALVTCSMIPQLIRIFQLKSAREISMLFTTLLLLGIVGWLTYGIYLKPHSSYSVECHRSSPRLCTSLC